MYIPNGVVRRTFLSSLGGFVGEMKLFDDGEIIPDWINSEFSNIYKGLIIDLCKDQPFFV